MIKVLQRNRFKKQHQKFSTSEKESIKHEIKLLMNDPLTRMPKKGTLAGTRVIKFKCHHQLILLAYAFEYKNQTIILEALGSHENFYRDLER